MDKKKEKNGKGGDSKKNAKSGGESGNDGWMDVDPNGEELLRAVKDPLDGAVKFQRELEKYAKSDLETLVLAYEVAMMRKKYLLALRAVRRAWKVAPEEADAVVLCSRLIAEIENNRDVLESLSDPVKEVFATEGSRALLGSEDLHKYCSTLMERKPKDTGLRLGCGTAMLRLSLSPSSSTDESSHMQLLTNLDGNVSVKTCEKVLVELKSLGATDELNGFKTAAAARFPRAAAFA